MKTRLNGFWIISLLLFGWAAGAVADQQVYLSTSPNERYRVMVDQVIDRRVGDRIFFRYPLSLINVREPRHHFQIMNLGAPLIQETDTQTYKILGAEAPTVGVTLQDLFDHSWQSIRFSWSKDSLKLFIRLEAIEGLWKTYFVDVNSGKTIDITADLEQPLEAKFDSRKWDCTEPRVTLLKWVEPHLAFFRLESLCGKDRTKVSNSVFRWSESVLFDTIQGKTVMGCDNSYNEESATRKFEQYYLSTIPTATPTPEETPVNQ